MDNFKLSEFTSAIDHWMLYIDPSFGLPAMDRKRIEKEVNWMDAEDLDHQTNLLWRALDVAKQQRHNRRLFVAMFLTTWWYTRLDDNFGERIHCFVDGYEQQVPSLQDAIQTWSDRDHWFGRDNRAWDAQDCVHWIKEQTGLRGYELVKALKCSLQADRPN